ncbi:hypothetical protein [Clostridium sp.]|uniref:hypothetical protein n=1 Tax=Clostridium sp. TaxID=1506 RepID=UPI003992D859
MIEINVFDFFWLVIGILGAICLVYLIVLLFNITKLVKNINNILLENKKDLTKSIENLHEVSDNVKDISNVLTETTAEALIVKDNISNQINSFKGSIGTFRNAFSLFKRK